MTLINLGNHTRYQRLPGFAPNDPDDSEDESVADDLDEDGKPSKKKKPFWSYILQCLLILLLFGPQYHILKMLVTYFLKINNSPFLFLTHLSMIHGLVFLSCCSMLVCIVRDPGAVRTGEQENANDGEDADGDEMDFMSALRMAPSKSNKTQAEDPDFNAPHKWCKKCWAPKPERTHHCSVCGRCVLKMDHHCPWLNTCLGHWNYTAFLHFLFCITILSSYLCVLSLRIVAVAFMDPLKVDEKTALIALFLTCYGAIFGLSTGSFFLWHAYLASTNQTTIENLSPFLLLRYLPTTEGSPSGVANMTRETPSTPADGSFATPASNQTTILREHELSFEQRRHVRYAHRHIRMYDVGFRENWRQIIGVDGKNRAKGWLYRIVFGGGGLGDGKTFPRNRRSKEQLAKLAVALASEERDD